jgi:MFS family permease
MEGLWGGYIPYSIRDTSTITEPMSSTIPSTQVIERTVQLERFRAIAMGIVESYGTFLLIILVRQFQGTSLDKSIIAAAGTGGLLFSPVMLFFSRKIGLPAPKALSRLLAISSLAFLLASMASSATVFVTLVGIGTLLPSTASPLLTSIFNNNYPPTRRGRLYAQNQAIRIFTSILFGSLAGWFITGEIHLYYVLIFIYAGALGWAAYLVSQIPGDNKSTPASPLLSCFQFLVTDALLRNTTISWMLLGFGNLMMLPLRVEYLANPAYGLNLTEVEIAAFVSVLPNLARLGGTYVWGHLFDSMNFFSLRIALNLSFLTGIISFFMTSSHWGLALSALIFGFSTSGGDVAWTLWVTKFAPSNRVPDYMAVHTFFTGIRGLLAPISAFSLLGLMSIQALSVVSGSLILMATVLLLFIREGAKNRSLG